MVEELVEDIGRPLLGGDYSEVDGMVAQAALRALNRRAQRKARSPSKSRIARIANEIELFVSALTPAAQVIDDVEVHTQAGAAAAWAQELRSGTRKLDEVYFDVKLVLGELRRHQTKLSLARHRDT